MPSFADSAVIFLLALLLFGPKKLPELARYVGKLMAEFRRASNEFRIQMEDEFRASEQEEQRKKIAAMEAAAPVTALPASDATTASAGIAAMQPITDESLAPAPEHSISDHAAPEHSIDSRAAYPMPSEPTAPLPIASSGALEMMPPPTGLPEPRTIPKTGNATSSLSSLFNSIPHAEDPQAPAEAETPAHG